VAKIVIQDASFELRLAGIARLASPVGEAVEDEGICLCAERFCRIEKAPGDSCAVFIYAWTS